MNRPRVLVLRALGLGDLLTAVPALRALRRALPDHSGVLAMPVALAPLLALADVDLEVLDVSGLGGPLDERADLAVNLHGRGPQSHELLHRVAPRQVAFANAEAGVRGPGWRADEHERDRWCRLVGETYAVPADPTDVRMRIPDRAPLVRNAVVVHPGAKAGSRRWPAQRWAAVVRVLVGDGHDVVVTGSAGELALGRRVAGDDARVVAGETDVAGLAALVGHARAVVCGDTGIGHLAAAYGVPSVHLFGPSRPQDWGPPPGPHRVLWHGTGSGAALADEVDPALLRISVAEVGSALAEVLGSPATARPAGRATYRVSAGRDRSRRAVERWCGATSCGR